MAQQQMPFMPGAGAVPGVDMLAGQIIQLTDTIEAMRVEMDSMNAELNRLQRRGRPEPEEREEELVDRKFFTPEYFPQNGIFRDWQQEFTDYIAGRDRRLGDLLESAAKQKEVIVTLGDDGSSIQRAEKLYRILKKLMVHTEARNIVNHVPNKNPWEAWRLLSARFDPKNNAYNSRSVRELLSVKAWKPKHMFDLPAQIAKWEHEQAEHKLRTGHDVLTESLKEDMLMQMISPEVKAQVEAAMLLVDDNELNYERLKKFIIKFIDRQLPPGGGASKDIDGLENPDDKYGAEPPPQPWWPDGSVDALGKGPRGDAKGGKGKTGKGKDGVNMSGAYGTGKGDGPTIKAGRQCNCCREWGHYGRECPNTDKVNPRTGKKFGIEYAERRAAKGNPKGGGKGGKVNGFEDAEADGEGMNDAKALDEDTVFGESAMDGWDPDDGDFFALALDTRKSAYSQPKFFGETFDEYSDSDVEQVDGLSDSGSEELEDLVRDLATTRARTSTTTSYISSPTSPTPTSTSRVIEAREQRIDPWQGGVSDPWSSTPQLGAAAMKVTPEEFRRRFGHLRLRAEDMTPPSRGSSGHTSRDGERASETIVESHLIVPSAPSSWSAPVLSPADASAHLASDGITCGTTQLGMSEGGSRSLMSAASPLHDHDANEGKGAMPKPSFGAYTDSEDEPLPLRESSESEASVKHSSSSD